MFHKTSGWKVPDSKAYEKVVGTFRKHQKGITFQDIAANTGLPLEQVKSLVPSALDEYSARLEVTESGEILFSFPGGFVSRYRGILPILKRFLSSLFRFFTAAIKLIFKFWILVMLIGYFLLFVAIAIASVFLSVSGSFNSRNRRSGRGGSMNFSFGIFNLFFRLWFYSEIFGSGRRRYGSSLLPGRKKSSGAGGQPLYKAVFSFVFGDDDPNRDGETTGRKEFISYLRKMRGVVSLPELIILTGLPPQDAETLMMQLCAEFKGSPEVTDEGTVVYRFEEILLSAEKNTGTNPDQNLSPGLDSGLPRPVYKKLKTFSANPKKLNIWFALINGVNLFFGTYFFSSSLSIGHILNEEVLRNSGIYGRVYHALSVLGLEAFPVIQIALGLVPFLFSLLFWLIPFIRSFMVKKENRTIRLNNFRSWLSGKIWSAPSPFTRGTQKPAADEYSPADLKSAETLVIKELNAFWKADISIGEKNEEIYSFRELGLEKDALEKYRLNIEAGGNTGKVIFDTE